MITYPFLMRLAESGQGELVLEGDRLRWRSRRRWQELNLRQAHKVRLAAGSSGLGKANACITLYPSFEKIHLRGGERKEMLGHFPEAQFFSELAVLPEEGGWGFVLDASDTTAHQFFMALLDCLWRNRHQNELFCLYHKFPWNYQPQPAFSHIRLIRWKERTASDEAFVAALERRVVDNLTDAPLRLTPDYLMGWVYEWFGIGDVWRAVMPLGYVRAKTSAGLESTELYVYGTDEAGKPLRLKFDWYAPTDTRAEEAEFVVRFINAMAERVQARGEG